MHVISILRKQSKYFLPFILLLGAVNSIVYMGLLAFINNAVNGDSLPAAKGYDWLVFAGLVAISLACTKVFQTYMVKLTQGLLLNYELSILQKLRFATWQAFEKLGAQRIYTAIGDVRILAYIPEVLVAVLNSSVIIVCALAYLFWVSPLGGCAVLLLTGSLLSFYVIRNKQIEKDLNTVRDLQNDYHQYLRDLIYGFKELKMSTQRNERLYTHYLEENRLKGKSLGTRSAVRYLDNELTGTYSWYIALGVSIFLLPQLLHLSLAQTVPFIVVILYLMGPLASLVKIIPYYTNVKIALERINGIREEIDAEVRQEVVADAVAVAAGPFLDIRFEQVSFEYYDDKRNKVFQVGPIDLNISKGEVVFISGGNGSGKSTFVNLLTGLYQPSGGQIYLNGLPVSAADYPAYSDQISAIFTNAYLFSENYDGFDLSAGNRELAQLIEMMQLSAVVRMGKDRNFIETGLSKGQQKRLAMIYAMMENRSILVLDEWAAEQDPQFRAYFYKHLIPELKKRGKTIIAVTHDDFYFECADRMLKFDYGNIVEDRRIFHNNERLLLKNKILTDE
jgi:cyclic peptide transporter